MKIGTATGDAATKAVAILSEAAAAQRELSEAGARDLIALRHSLTSTLANADVLEEIGRRIVGHESAALHALRPLT